MKTQAGTARLARAGIAAALVLGWVASADARITRIEITRVESPTFGGASFGSVGTYDKLVGRAFGEVDPREAQNAGIQDLLLAGAAQCAWVGRVLDGCVHLDAARSGAGECDDLL